MKIGQFANKNNISIDTVRHYIDMGLIIPNKNSHLYDFDSRCQADLNELMKLKEMKFTLKEIKLIFILKRLGKLTKVQNEQWYKEFFEMKYNSIIESIDELIKVKNKIEKEIEEMILTEDSTKSTIGIDIKSLDFLRCNKCGDELILADGNIVRNKILNGVIQCKCGKRLVIEDGIILANQKEAIYNENNYENFSLVDYINNTKEEFLETLCTSMEWIYKNMEFHNLNNKLILELGSGFGFLIRTIYEDLPDNCTYVLVDNDLSRHKYLKNILENVNCRKNLIFICSDFLDIPIKENSVDLVLDVAGSSYYCMENEKFLIKEIDKYTKKDTQLVGAYIIFENFSENSMIYEEYRKNFILSNIDEELNKLYYKETNKKILQKVEKLGEYEIYCTEGEKLFNYLSVRKKVIK